MSATRLPDEGNLRLGSVALPARKKNVDGISARLLDVGYADIRLLVERPPRTLADAERVAAEHYVFADECGGQGPRDIRSIAVGLVLAPIWAFWWD